MNRGGWFATLPMLVLEKVFVNPDFSTSPVQALPTSLLYQGTGTPLRGSFFGLPRLQAPNSQAEAAKIRYNAGRLDCNAKWEAKGNQGVFHPEFRHENARERLD